MIGIASCFHLRKTRRAPGERPPPIVRRGSLPRDPLPTRGSSARPARSIYCWFPAAVVASAGPTSGPPSGPSQGTPRRRTLAPSCTPESSILAVVEEQEIGHQRAHAARRGVVHRGRRVSATSRTRLHSGYSSSPDRLTERFAQRAIAVDSLPRLPRSTSGALERTSGVFTNVSSLDGANYFFKVTSIRLCSASASVTRSARRRSSARNSGSYH